MKRTSVALLILVSQTASAANPLWLNNLSENATGTLVGSKQALDVYVADGSLTFTEEATAADGAAAPALGKVVMGVDGAGNAQFVLTDTDGRLTTNRNWTLSSVGDSVTAHQGGTWNLNDISGTISLPTGASTEAKQDDILAGLSVVAQESTLLTIDGTTSSIDGTLGVIDGKITKADTDDVTVTSSALPTGAATEAKQDAGNTTLSTIDGKITAVDTGNVTVASSALPTGAATAANQTTANASLSAIDGKLNSLGQKTSANSVPVVLASDQSGIPVSQAAPTAKTVKQAAITVGTSAVRLTTDGSAPTAGRVYLSFRSDDGNTANCYWGSSSVASSGGSRGLKVFSGESVELRMDAGEYYAICDAASQTFYVVEQE